MMGVGAHLGFLVCVAVATFAQNTTGFAFGLLLLGLTGLLQLAPVETVANVSSVLTLVNAFVMLRRRPEIAPRLLMLILACSLLGVVGGVELLSLLGTHERDLLQLLLGATIVVCSFLLVVRSRHLERLSGWISFSCFAGLSGVMGDLFSSAGPPLVYQLYRQPLAAHVVRDTLIVVFAVNAFVRLCLLIHRAFRSAGRLPRPRGRIGGIHSDLVHAPLASGNEATHPENRRVRPVVARGNQPGRAGGKEPLNSA